MAFSDPQQNLESLGIQEGSYVADLGSGSGFYSFAAARLVGGGGKVYSIDVQQDLLSRIKNAAHVQKLHNIEVIHGDIERLGGTRLREASIDIVLLCNVLFQVEHKQDCVNEVKRILKPGGRVLIVDWQDSFGGMGPAPEHVFTELQVQELYEKSSFVFISSIDAGDHHYGVVYRKG
ncbi:MAG: class I SAM-dependent methyltransferase [bacterium]|nr:class I SAM-dependent methyltransferase [bacterium]